MLPLSNVTLAHLTNLTSWWLKRPVPYLSRNCSSASSIFVTWITILRMPIKLSTLNSSRLHDDDGWLGLSSYCGTLGILKCCILGRREKSLDRLLMNTAVKISYAFFGINIVGLIGITSLLLTICLSPSVKRHPVFVNLILCTTLLSANTLFLYIFFVTLAVHCIL